MNSLPSQKTLRSFFWVVTIFLGLSLGSWLSLSFILEMEKMQEYTIVYKFWYGVYLSCKFVSLGLAACLVVLIALRIIVAILDENNTDRHSSAPSKPTQTRPSNSPDIDSTSPYNYHEPQPGEPGWQPTWGDMSDFD